MRLARRRLATAAVALVVAIQFVPVHRDNPPVRGELQAPPEVQAVLRRSCYDCHSVQTRWPWYSYVAPVSWLVAHDVHEGRGQVDFTGWSAMPPRKQAHVPHECAEQVEHGDMPLWIYRVAHPDAKLSSVEVAILQRWAESIPVAPGGDGETRRRDGDH